MNNVPLDFFVENWPSAVAWLLGHPTTDLINVWFIVLVRLSKLVFFQLTSGFIKTQTFANFILQKSIFYISWSLSCKTFLVNLLTLSGKLGHFIAIKNVSDTVKLKKERVNFFQMFYIISSWYGLNQLPDSITRWQHGSHICYATFI